MFVIEVNEDAPVLIVVLPHSKFDVDSVDCDFLR